MAIQYSTLDDFIALSSTRILTYNNLSFIDTANDIDFPIFNVVSDYTDELKESAVNVKLSDSEFSKYIYKPKLLAETIYGNGELYFVILALNNICNVKEFDFQTIKLLKKEDIISMLSKIYNSEISSITQYNNKS